MPLSPALIGTRTKSRPAREQPRDLLRRLPPARASTCSREACRPASTRRTALSRRRDCSSAKRRNVRRIASSAGCRDGGGSFPSPCRAHRAAPHRRCGPGAQVVGVGLDELGCRAAAGRGWRAGALSAGLRQIDGRDDWRRPRRARPSCRRAPRTDRRRQVRRRDPSSRAGKAAAASCTHQAPSA